MFFRAEFLSQEVFTESVIAAHSHSQNIRINIGIKGREGIYMPLVIDSANIHEIGITWQI